jgi:eukaryotic-like serine/threonine-protein kinase
MSRSLQPGELFGEYLLNALVATSAMSSVFRATDIRNGLVVAVKIPASDKSSLPSHKRSGEAQLMSKLNHTGIVRIFQDGSVPHSCVVTEWAAGRTLRRIIDRRELSMERFLGISLNICNVLSYIHECGIVHLDLKPDNIIVDSGNHVKLIDFDLASEIKPSFFSRLRSKRSGTPDYASPEQIKGKSVGILSDLYSFGLVLYEMLTGEVPFSGVAPAAATQLRLRTDPLPPSEINSEIFPELDDLICRAISRDPKGRPASVAEISFHLAQIQGSLRGTLGA